MSDRHFKFWPDHSRQHLDAPATNVFYNLEVSARRYPTKPGLVYYDTPIGFAEIHDEAQRIAGYLEQRCGVRKGDRVLLYMQNSPQFVIAYYGILRANAVVVPLNPMYLTQEFLRCAKDAGTTTAIVSQELYSRIAPLLDSRDLEHVIVAAYSDYLKQPTNLSVPEFIAAPRVELSRPGITLWGDALASGLPPGPLSAGPDDLCVMPYTSGTTGEPRACMHTHRTTMHTLVASMRWFTVQPELTMLAVAPFFHVTGMQGSMNGPLYNGNTVVLLPRWDRVVAAECVQRYRIASWTAVPTMIQDFFMNPNIERYDLSSIRRLSGGGAAMPAAVAQRLLHRGITYCEGYGLSETMAATHINPPDRAKQQCLGIPIYGVDSRVVDPASGDELAAGEVGEIVTHGPQVFLGYWNKPQDSAQAFIEIDGKRFLRTGDLGTSRRRRLLLHGRPAQTHDQCVRIQGVADRGRIADVPASRRARGLRHRRERRASRRDRQGPGRAAAGMAGTHRSRGDHRLVPREHGGVQGPEDRRIHRCAAQIGQRQDSVARTAGSRTAGRSRAQRRGRASGSA